MCGVGCRFGVDNARGKSLPSPAPCNYPYHQSGYACQLPPPLGEEALGWVGALGTANLMSLPCARGDEGKRVRSAHNAKGVSDPQSTTEASTDHG